MQETLVAVKRALVVSLGSAADCNIDEAVAQPPDLQRLVIARTVHRTGRAEPRSRRSPYRLSEPTCGREIATDAKP
jgi:hypothetical protein